MFPCCVSSAKSSHPKKTGCTTKNTPASTSTLHPRVTKDSGGAAQHGGTVTRTNRKSDTPPSCEPQKDSVETPDQCGKLKSSPLLSDTKSTSSNETEGTQNAYQQGLEPECAPKVSAVGEKSHKSMAPDPTVQPPHIHAAGKDTSFAKEELDSSSVGDNWRREGRVEEQKNVEKESAMENSLR